jgi:VIT1/CCC1 family predicted Fe2+/Mn2+ transporter
MRHAERHRTERIGRLRAAVLGANDGIVSTASLVVGVAASGSSAGDVLVAGIAGLVAGALSMAAGGYVSVSSQADTARADLARERSELQHQPATEEDELAAIYVQRGLKTALARTVAQQLMAHDALGAHARDELGLSEMAGARPLQAALAPAATFSIGAPDSRGGGGPVVARDFHRVRRVAGLSLRSVASLHAPVARRQGLGRRALASGVRWRWL